MFEAKDHNVHAHATQYMIDDFVKKRLRLYPAYKLKEIMTDFQRSSVFLYLIRMLIGQKKLSLYKSEVYMRTGTKYYQIIFKSCIGPILEHSPN